MTTQLTQRPTQLTAFHNYNLRNNGWPTTFSCLPNIQGDGVPVETDPVEYTSETQGIYPSLADVLQFSKASAVVDPQNLDAYSPWSLTKFVYGNTPAPQGHYILNAFNRDRTSATGIPGLYNAGRDLDDFRATSVEFYAGRVWYLKSNGEVLFSQILSDISRADRCYQDADPTAEEINDIVATDGGVIRIRDIGEGYKLIATGAALLVMASNGVWAISGTDAQGFTATNLQTNKITNEGVVAPESAVLAEDSVFFWGESGIYGSVADQVTGQTQIRNVTEDVIQSKFLNIDSEAKKNARGHYDPENRKIYWLYNTTNVPGQWRFRYSNVLIFDTVLGAWYDYTLPAGRRAEGTPTHVAGLLERTRVGVDVEGEDDIRLDEVSTKFLVVDEASTDVYNYAWAEFKDLSFTDFTTSSEGSDYSSVIETGTSIVDSPMTTKFGIYLYTFFSRTETSPTPGSDVPNNQSACKFRTKWNWADSAAANKWSAFQDAYRFRRPTVVALKEFPVEERDGDDVLARSGEGVFVRNSDEYVFDYGHEVIESRNKVLGSGRSFNIRFESETGKDFKFLGWGMPIHTVTGI